METNCFSIQAPSGTGGISRRAVLGNLAGGSALLVTIMGQGRAQAQTTPAPEEAGQAPNHFVLAGEETRIVYDETAGAGEPRLTYEGPYGSQTFAGDTLRTEESTLGRLVTGSLGAFPDQGELWLTLLLPEFNPTTIDADPTPFATLAILKWVVSTIAGPPRTGALEEYRVVPLEGTAQLVMA
jgi:hypothetical protein